jgi:hypothetical protein
MIAAGTVVGRGVESSTFDSQFKAHPEGVVLPGTSRSLPLRVGF